MQSLSVGCSGQWLSGKDALVPPVYLARLENLGCMAKCAVLPHRHGAGCSQAWGVALYFIQRCLVSVEGQLHICSSVHGEEGHRNGQKALVCPGPLSTSALV